MSRNEDFNAFMDFTKQSLGLDDSTIQKFSIDVANHFSGEQIYISNSPKREDRNRKIKSLYNGGNAEDLAKRFHLTSRQIFNIVRN